MTSVAGFRQLRTVQMIWLALAVLLTTGCAIIAGSQWHALQTPCQSATACSGTQLSRASMRLLSEHGISMTAFAAYIEIVLAAVWSVSYGIAALIISRKPDDRGAVMSAYFLILFPAIMGGIVLPASAPRFLVGLLIAPGLMALMLFCLLFPDGRFTPGWTRWLAGAGIISTIPVIASTWWWAEIPWLLILLADVGVQVYRYRTVSSWEQRQKTKWALAGLVVAIVGFVAIILSYAFPWASSGTVYSGFSTGLISIVPTVIPITIGVAMLRSRLWDIDRVINRALVYTSLTATLAAFYVASIILLQTLSQAVTGRQSDLAVAISTLALAALFNPWHRRLQRLIDQRFFHSKYDAQRMLAILGERLRDQVELGRLTEELEGAVYTALKPEHVALWLKDAMPHEAESGGDRTAMVPTASHYS